MPLYEITWVIDVEADTPRDAVIEALNIQQDPFSEALFFTAMDSKTKEIVEIDLLLDEEED